MAFIQMCSDFSAVSPGPSLSLEPVSSIQMQHPQFCWRNSSSSFPNGNGLFQWFWRMRMPHHERICHILPTWFGTHEAEFPIDTIWCQSSHLRSRNKIPHSMSQNLHGKWWSMSSKKVKKQKFWKLIFIIKYAGLNTMIEITKGEAGWDKLFEEINFFTRYKHFIALLCVTANEEDHLIYNGLVESKIRHLVASLER